MHSHAFVLLDWLASTLHLETPLSDQFVINMLGASPSLERQLQLFSTVGVPLASDYPVGIYQEPQHVSRSILTAAAVHRRSSFEPSKGNQQVEEAVQKGLGVFGRSLIGRQQQLWIVEVDRDRGVFHVRIAGNSSLFSVPMNDITDTWIERSSAVPSAVHTLRAYLPRFDIQFRTISFALLLLVLLYVYLN